MLRVLPGGMGKRFEKTLPLRTAGPGGKMPPSTAAKMAAAKDVNPTLDTYPLRLVRCAPDFADRDNKSDQTGNQQPGTALDRHQDANAEDDAHSDPDRESTKQFHGTDVTGRSLRFNSAFLRTER